MNIINSFSVLHTINIQQNTIAERTADVGDLSSYIEELTKNILKKGDSRVFGIQSESTEVISLIIDSIKCNNIDVYKRNCEKVSRRLLRQEIEAQEKYKNITDIKRGSLIQCFLEIDGIKYYMAVKIEHNPYLDEIELIKRIGLPYEGGYLKICLVEFGDDCIVNISLKDSNPKITKYWWNDFLELKETNTNEYNTRIAFNEVKKVLNKKVKNNSPTDYTLLHNNLLGYFRTHKSFEYEDMVNNVFGSYQPDNPSGFKFDELKDVIKKLPEQRKFDRKFEIIHKEITSRMRSTYKLHQNINLSVKGNIENLKDIIKSYKEVTGEKYVMIKTDNEDIYNKFDYKHK